MSLVCSLDTHIFQLGLQQLDHVLFDDEARLVEVFDDVIVALLVDVDDDGLDGRLALDEDTWKVSWYDVLRVVVRYL